MESDRPAGELQQSSARDSAKDKVAALLEAALPEFALAGLAGARVDVIARAAGMNKRLLYHYVGNKAALFDAALDLAYDRVLKAPEELNSHEWRLICQGVASGRSLRVHELTALAGAGPGPAGASAIGLRLLAGLLPQLTDLLLGNQSGSAADRAKALRSVLQGRGSGPAKPRLTLHPDLRRGGAPKA
jgi:AcrR family transcriptional regulator